MSGTLVELCAGTASVSLWALAAGLSVTRHRQRWALVGFMGGKQRWAPLIVDALDIVAPDRVVLVDAGPWGDTWTVLREARQRRAVASALDAMGDGPTPLHAPPDDPVARVVQFLAVQYRSANTMPTWWDGEKWASGAGGGLFCESGTRGLVDGSRDLKNRDFGDIATRLRALDRLPWDRVEVVHGDVRDVAPIPGATVILDPPYLGAPRYAALFPRADVLAVAERWRSARARVAVCEAEPLADLVSAGWHATRLPAVRRDQPEPREWLTTSWPVVVERQLVLGAA